MKKHIIVLSMTSALFAAGTAMAMKPALSVEASDQDVSGGSVTAEMIKAEKDGWLVVHKTDGMKPGPVIGHAWLDAGENSKVTAELSEDVAPGDKLMLMLHGEEGGMKAGEFEYTLGAKEDGPVKVDGKLVMSIITAQ